MVFLVVLYGGNFFFFIICFIFFIIIIVLFIIILMVRINLSNVNMFSEKLKISMKLNVLISEIGMVIIGINVVC